MSIDRTDIILQARLRLEIVHNKTLQDQNKQLEDRLEIADATRRYLLEENKNLRALEAWQRERIDELLKSIEPTQIPLEPMVEQVSADAFSQLQQDADLNATIEAAAEGFARMEQDADVDAAIAAAAEEIARFEQEAEMTGNVTAAIPVAVVAPMKQEPVKQKPEPGFNETELRQGWYSDDEGNPVIIPFQPGRQPGVEWDMNTQPFI